MFELTKFNRKGIFLFISLILILGLGLSGCSEDVQGIVARVNDEDISQDEFDREFKIYRESHVRQLGEDALSEVLSDGRTLETFIKQNVLDTLIVERLILQDSEIKDINVTDEEVKETIDELIDSFGGELEFEEFLESNAMTREYFTNYTRNDLIFTKHIDDYREDIVIEDQYAQEYFAENKEDLEVLRASHILLSSEEDGNRILAALKNGEDFEQLAITESKDSGSAINGGDLGPIVRGQYTGVQEFEKAVFELEVGEISDLVETEVGYHIIRLDEKKDTFEELKDEIEILLKNQEYTNYIGELRDKGKIVVYMEIM